MSDLDLADWFGEDELETCPQCGSRLLVPPSAESVTARVCLSCGVVPTPGAES
ncbi:MAG: hypothetical protein QOH95_2366 [Gaiellaceae bacterium]|jgi:RNA polymerase subunit RPABC4/transcription elongation factor Spt4|nr:hypothetical protein [Gaiellaceae bacterium]